MRAVDPDRWLAKPSANRTEIRAAAAVYVHRDSGLQYLTEFSVKMAKSADPLNGGRSTRNWNTGTDWNRLEPTGTGTGTWTGTWTGTDWNVDWNLNKKFKIIHAEPNLFEVK